MRHVLIVGEAAVADFQHIRVVEVSRGSVLPELDIAGVDDLDPVPPRTDIGRGAPHVARRRAPQPGFAEAPFADGEEDGFDLFAAFFSLLAGGAHETAGHMTVLHGGGSLGVGHGIAELDRIPARFEGHHRLEARGEVPMLLRGEVDPVRCFSVDGDAEILLVLSVFFYADGEHILARAVDDDVVEDYAARARVHAGHILPAGQFLILHPARVSFQDGVGHRIVRLLAAPLLGHRDRIDQRRVGRDFLVVAEVVLEILEPPLRDGARVGELAPEAGGQILAGQRAVGGIYPDLEPEIVDLPDERGDPFREPDQLRLPLAVFVAHVGVPVVVEVDIDIPRVREPRLFEGEGGVVDEFLIDVVAESVPARPPHERRLPHAVLIGLNAVFAVPRGAREQLA